MPPVVKNLLIINAICFIGGALIFPRANDLFGVYYPDSPGFHIWQVITYMFMHGGFAHIFFNMFALFMFGPMIERHLGEIHASNNPERGATFTITLPTRALIDGEELQQTAESE